MNQQISNALVSTDCQHLGLLRDALTRAGCEPTYEEIASENLVGRRELERVFSGSE